MCRASADPGAACSREVVDKHTLETRTILLNLKCNILKPPKGKFDNIRLLTGQWQDMVRLPLLAPSPAAFMGIKWIPSTGAFTARSLY